jgi:hypothetical protein
MPGDSGVTVVTTPVWLFFLPAGLRAHRAPGIPCALFQEDATLNIKPRAKNTRRDREVMFGCHHPRRRVIQYSRGIND